MAKKRKTLPKDFEALLAGGDLAAIQAVLAGCEVDATGGFGDRTALAFGKCSDDLSRWLVAQGANIDAVDRYGNTPLHSRITYGGSIEVLLELGASLELKNASIGTALHCAAAGAREAQVRTLLAAGAKIDAPNRRGQTALEVALERAHNAQLPSLVRVARILLEAGAQRTPAMRAAITRIGETFEFHRAGFNRDSLPEASAALEELYALFGVPPVPRRVMHDGMAPIVASSAPWRTQHDELWNALVPSSGAAKTVQGEVIRISGRIADEIFRNGGGNWDEQYRAMARALAEHLATGEAMSERELAELRAGLRGRPAEETCELAMQLAVRWVRKNPTPVTLAPPSYRR